MKLLITGASGLLGRGIMKELALNRQWIVIGTALTRVQSPLIRLDLLDKDAVEELILKEKPNFIIHAAAQRKPDVSMSDPAYTVRLNVSATGHLAAIAARLGVKVLYMSTDYVFDGKAPPYTPQSSPHPLNLYGKSKLDGERAIWAATADACVLRVPILYGEVESLDESPITIIARQIRADTPVEIDNWAVRYPTHVRDVAFVIRHIIEYKLKNPAFSGTFHWSGDEAYTKYQMARLMAPIVGVSGENIIPHDSPPAGAPRPKNSHLDCSLLKSMNIGQITSFQDSIRDILDPFLK